MTKRTKGLITMLIFTIALAVLLTGILAWFTRSTRLPFVEINKGEISTINTFKYNDKTLLKGVPVNVGELAFVDFDNDIVQDKYGVLNELAAVLQIQITVPVGSREVKNLISIEASNRLSTPTPDGMFYFIINEGVYGDGDTPSALVTDYHTYMLSKVPALSSSSLTDEQKRLAVTAYNEATIIEISDNVLDVYDTQRCQVIFWGDYDVLPAEFQSYLLGDGISLTNRIIFDVKFKVTTTNGKGEF